MYRGRDPGVTQERRASGDGGSRRAAQLTVARLAIPCAKWGLPPGFGRCHEIIGGLPLSQLDELDVVQRGPRLTSWKVVSPAGIFAGASNT